MDAGGEAPRAITLFSLLEKPSQCLKEISRRILRRCLMLRRRLLEQLAQSIEECLLFGGFTFIRAGQALRHRLVHFVKHGARHLHAAAITFARDGEFRFAAWETARTVTVPAARAKTTPISTINFFMADLRLRLPPVKASQNVAEG